MCECLYNTDEIIVSCLFVSCVSTVYFACVCMYVCMQTVVPESVETFIRACTLSYGKAKLVLKHNKHYIESPFPEVLRELLKNSTVRRTIAIILYRPHPKLQ